jgi:hypothetical protein
MKKVIQKLGLYLDHKMEYLHLKKIHLKWKWKKPISIL